ncbi:phospho-sugar mutase [Streptomyces californicus]
MQHDLIAQARTWLAEDPDPETRDELAALIESGATQELAVRFAGTLQFGTAGLRGELGAGPMRMNRSVVIRAAAGLAAYLKAQGQDGGLVVIGYDARYKSADFARDTAAVMTGAGLRAAVLPRPLPTPVLAYAIRHLGAVAGVEVTASHNPPRDNGYKVYLGDGSQIVPPADGEIAAAIAAVARWRTSCAPRTAGRSSAERPRRLPGPARTRSCRRQPPYRPHRLHGDARRRRLAPRRIRAGRVPRAGARRRAPTGPGLPTVAFPKPGGARRDGSRLREGPRDGPRPGHRQRPGRGPLRRGGRGRRPLAHAPRRRGGRAARRPPGEPRSPGHLRRVDRLLLLLGRIAERAGLPYEETLTGFKWIARVDGLRYGYEEALDTRRRGHPRPARHHAAPLTTELASVLKEQGGTLLDLLDGPP